MFVTNVPIIYYSECKVNYEDLSYNEILKKYGITIPKNIKKENNLRMYDYITSEESITVMNNSNITYKELSVLYDNNNSETIYLNKPITFKVEVDEYGIYYISEKYNLYVYGATQEETENNLVEAFKDQMLSFCYEDDDTLDTNALLLKKDLLEVYNYAEKKE